MRKHVTRGIENIDPEFRVFDADVDVRSENEKTIRKILPNAQTPTLLPIEGSPDQVALQAVCYGAITWTHLEDMKRAGASQLLVLPVEKILA